MYRAGTFILEVKVNEQNVAQSPWNPLMVAPSDIYAPSCVPLGIPTTMIAGTQYTFKIQSRDFYSNNMELNLANSLGSDYKITYQSGDNIVQAALSDDSQLGVFKVTVTITKTGLYSLRILFKELEVPTSLTEQVKVTPKLATSPL